MEIIKNFIYWKENLNKSIRGGKLMFDTPFYYKWIDETELFEYWINNIK